MIFEAIDAGLSVLQSLPKIKRFIEKLRGEQMKVFVKYEKPRFSNSTETPCAILKLTFVPGKWESHITEIAVKNCSAWVELPPSVDFDRPVNFKNRPGKVSPNAVTVNWTIPPRSKTETPLHAVIIATAIDVLDRTEMELTFTTKSWLFREHKTLSLLLRDPAGVPYPKQENEISL